MPTEKSRNKVKLLLAFDWSVIQIANALGVAPPTLRKHYFSELKVRAMARDALNAEMLQSLYEQAEKGNVGAVKQLQVRLDRVDMERRAREAAGEGQDADKPVRPVAKGKKEQALESAAEVLASHPLLDPLRLN